MPDIQKILIRGVNWIGDAVLTTVGISAIREAFPGAWISLLVKPWIAQLFKEDPSINEIILYDNHFNSIPGKFKLARILRTKRFDIAILLQNAFDAAFITWLSRIPRRIGYSRDFRRPLLTDAIPMKDKTLKQHQVYYYLNLLKESLNIEPKTIEPRIYLTDEEIQQARSLLNSKFQSPRFIIGINPGATYGPAKRWMPEGFAGVIQKTIKEMDGRIVLFGSSSEVNIANEIIEAIKDTKTSHILNLTGKTNLRELSALISQCDAFITNDSGPMHIASALRVPIVAIFGSTDKETTGPLGNGHKVVSKDPPCSPCLKRECPEGHLRCLREITPEDVFNALQEVIPRQRAVFLDRDGTLNEDVGYLNNLKDLKIFDGTYQNLQRLKTAGFKLIGITNQSGIARGIVSEDFVRQTNTYLQETLGIDDFYYCPHHPDDRCQCRKPRPMLLHKARLKHRIDLKASYVIGDKTIDILLAKAVGAKGILVLTGHDRESEDADFIARDLREAVDWILGQE
jgi:heptosyltransferase-2